MEPADNKSERKDAYWLAAICSIVLVSLNVARIVHVPVTYDEALTYNTYVTNSYQAILNYDNPAPNNHLLNTLLTKFFVTSFSSNVFFLRLANMLAQIVFLFFSFQVSNLLFENKWMITGSFLLLNVHPFLFEFWGLCRGYGLSMGFLMGSIYYLMRYLDTICTRFLILSLLFCIAAIYSNFTLLHLFPTLVMVIAMRHFITGKAAYKRFFSSELPVISAAALLLFLLVAPPVKKLTDARQLYYGGDTGIFHDTIRSLVQDCFFIKDGSPVINMISYCCTGSVVLIFLYLLRLHVKRKGNTTTLDVFFLLLAVPVLSAQLQHSLLGTKFLISRTALFLLPLYILLILSFMQRSATVVAYMVLLSLLVVASINFFINYNTYDARIWEFDRYDLQVMRKMKNEGKKDKITVGSFRLFTPVLQYYAATTFPNGFPVVENILDFDNKDTVFDYYYIDKQDIPKMSALYRVDTLFGGQYALIVRKNL